MTNPKPNRALSLGQLRPNEGTKPKSPHATGTIRIKRDLLIDLHQQMTQSDDDELVADLAGWFNEDGIGKYLTIQLSAKFQRAEPRDCGKFFNFR
jgi:hypothetical protein